MAELLQFCPVTGKARTYRQDGYSLPPTGEYLVDGYDVLSAEVLELDLTAREEVYAISADLIDTIAQRTEQEASQRGKYGLLEGLYPDQTPVVDVPLSFPHIGDLLTDTVYEDIRVVIAGLQSGEGSEVRQRNFSRMERILNWRGTYIAPTLYTPQFSEDRIISAAERFIRRGARTAGSMYGVVTGSIPELYSQKYGKLPDPDTFSLLTTHAGPALYASALSSLYPFHKFQHVAIEEVSVNQKPGLYELGIRDQTKLSEEGNALYQKFLEEFKNSTVYTERFGHHGCPAMAFFNGSNAVDKTWKLYQRAADQVYSRWYNIGSNKLSLLREQVQE